MPGTRHSRLIVRDEREWNRYRRPIRRSGSPHRTRYTEPHTSLLAVTLVYIALFLRSRCVSQFVVQFVKRARIKKEKSKKRKYIFNWYSLGSGGLVGWPCAIESIIYLVVEPFRIIIGNIMVPALWPDLNIVVYNDAVYADCRWRNNSSSSSSDRDFGTNDTRILTIHSKYIIYKYIFCTSSTSTITSTFSLRLLFFILSGVAAILSGHHNAGALRMLNIKNCCRAVLKLVGRQCVP